MNADQKLVAFIGLTLIALVLWGVYNPTIKAVLFNTPVKGGATGTGVNPTGESGQIIHGLEHFIP
jgi:hypothetical protein